MKTRSFLLLAVLLVLSGCSWTPTNAEELGISFDVPPKFTLTQEDKEFVVSKADGQPIVRFYDATGWSAEDTWEGWIAEEGMTLEGATAIMEQQDPSDPYKLVRSGKNGCGAYVARYQSNKHYDAFGICPMGDKLIFCSADPNTYEDDANNIMLICESMRPMGQPAAEGNEA